MAERMSKSSAKVARKAAAKRAAAKAAKPRKTAPRAASKPLSRKAAKITSILCCVSLLALVTAAAPARSGEQAANDKHVLPSASSLTNSTEGDCETRIRKLEASQAEGEERLAEKHLVMDYCASRYKNDKTIERLVRECAKYEEQPVMKQQFVAECQLAAFNYANILYTLKAEYRK